MTKRPLNEPTPVLCPPEAVSSLGCVLLRLHRGLSLAHPILTTLHKGNTSYTHYTRETHPILTTQGWCGKSTREKEREVCVCVCVCVCGVICSQVIGAAKNLFWSHLVLDTCPLNLQMPRLETNYLLEMC